MVVNLEQRGYLFDLIKVPICRLSDFLIGHAEDIEAGTGVTVIIAEKGATGSVEERGSSPATRNTAALEPIRGSRCIHAVVLAGGSAFGLSSCDGVMNFLESNGIGRDIGVTKIPNVAGAVLFDLLYGDYKIRPNAAMGWLACENAFARKEFKEGSFGAGTGATIGKIRGLSNASKGGQGCYALKCGEVYVGAIVAVNAAGDVLKGDKIIAGALDDTGKTFVSTTREMLKYVDKPSVDLFNPIKLEDGHNTIIACIITNAKLDKTFAKRIAMQGQNAVARTINMPHSSYDGDTIFVMASNSVEANANVVGIMAMEVITQAIWSAVEHTKGEKGYKNK